jgi:hypothetical protein
MQLERLDTPINPGVAYPVSLYFCQIINTGLIYMRIFKLAMSLKMCYIINHE